MLEPYDGKLSRTVLRREGGGNTADPADYPDYRKAKEEMQELLRAQKNIELFFDEEKKPEQTEPSR